jgi:hypothetical protein
MIMNKQQTAVEWLYEQIPFEWSSSRAAFEALQQAKAMEKEQIMDAHIEGQRVFDDYQHTQWTNDKSEEYYKATYGTEDLPS